MKIFNNQKIFGREKEIKLIKKAIESDRSELFAIYGKRRIGKTFLLTHCLKEVENNNKDVLFLKLTGQFNTDNKVKLNRCFLDIENFLINNNISFLFENFSKIEKKWESLFAVIEKIAIYLKEQRKTFILYIDEISWLSDKKGQFVSYFSFSWNQVFNDLGNVKIFISGSATHWIVKNIIKNKGGLHRRLTYEVQLLPFSYDEHVEYFAYYHPNMSKYNVFLVYLIFGGVPYYISHYDSTSSVEENIKSLFNGILKDEYHQMLSSLFEEKNCHRMILEYLVNNKNYHSQKNIISFIQKKKSSVSHQTIISNLEELKHCGFVKETNYFNHKTKNKSYKINDLFVFFYLKMIENNKFNTLFSINSQEFSIWSGYAFELFLSNQIELIKEKLGIKNIKSIEYSWNNFVLENQERNVQLDLIIERNDNIINIVEAKFYQGEFILTKQYKKELFEKMEIFKNFISNKPKYNKKDVSLVIVSLFGVKEQKNREEENFYLNYETVSFLNNSF